MPLGCWLAHGQDLGIAPSSKPYHPSPGLPGLLWAVVQLALEYNLGHIDLSRSVSYWKPSMAPDRTVSVPSFL